MTLPAALAIIVAIILYAPAAAWWLDRRDRKQREADDAEA